MRATVIGFIANSEPEVLRQARESAECSHGHPEGIRGAQAAALAVYLARQSADKDQIARRMHEHFDYLLFYDLDEVSESYGFDSSAENTVPLAIFIAFEATSYENCLRKVLQVGGDTDTLMCIAGAIVEARRDIGVDEKLSRICREFVAKNHPDVLAVVEAFYKRLAITSAL